MKRSGSDLREPNHARRQKQSKERHTHAGEQQTTPQHKKKKKKKEEEKGILGTRIELVTSCV
jgi:hypothetical protein